MQLKNSGMLFKLRHEIVLLIFLLPLLFININNYHDWGDDFAHYLLQAKYFSGTISSIPVSDISGYSPEKKGLLFSLMLAPATYLGENEMAGAKILVSFTLMLCGMVCYKLIKTKYNPVVAILIALFFVYNYHILQLKDQVLPDFLFTAVVTGVFLLMQSIRRNDYFIALCFAGLSTGIRTAGYALVLTLLVSILAQHSTFHKENKMKSVIILMMSSFLILCWEILSSSFSSGGLWYASLTWSHLNTAIIIDNYVVYKNALGLFFEQEMPQYFNVALKFTILIGFAGGLLFNLWRGHRLAGLFVVVYLIFLLCYPYNSDPIRFLIPVIPFMLLFILDFYSWIIKHFTITSTSIPALIIAIILVGSQVISTKKELSKVRVYEPHTPASREMINFIMNDIPANDTLSFNKPWALAYYTGRNFVSATAAYKAQWIVLPASNINFTDFSAKKAEEVVFSNEDYVIISSK